MFSSYKQPPAKGWWDTNALQEELSCKPARAVSEVPRWATQTLNLISFTLREVRDEAWRRRPTEMCILALGVQELSEVKKRLEEKLSQQKPRTTSVKYQIDFYEFYLTTFVSAACAKLATLI